VFNCAHPNSSQRPVRATAQRTPVPTDFGPDGTPVARLQRPFGLDPLMHRANKTRPIRVRMEARRPTRAQGFPPEITALS
jgi:hypothetical protein